MRYNIKNILGTSALALVLSLSFVNLSLAQGVIKLDDKSKSQNAEEFTDEISLFGDDNKSSVITPAKSSSGVKSAAELGLGGKAKPKSAAELGLGGSAKPKSAAELGLGGNAKPKSAAELGLGGNAKQKSAAELGLGGNAKPKSAAELGLGGNAKVKSVQQTPSGNEVSAKSEQPIKTAPAQVQLVKDVDDKIFDQMSELEKQTAILNLELKKEKVQNSIDSLKAIRSKAQQEELARKEAEKRKQQEWENEQEKMLLQEKQRLKSLEIALENARQEKILKAYKNKMLKEMQDFIASKEETYKELAALRQERAQLINDFKGRFVQLKQLADQATSDAIQVRDEHAKIVSDLQTQISILNARLDATTAQQNPFADGEQPAAEESAVKLSDMYAIMEIRGKGADITAKLINASGQPFWVKKGTTLQSGHVVDEISQTYVRTDRNGSKEYLYFSAGGILDKEPVQTQQINVNNLPEEPKKDTQFSSAVYSAEGIPNMSAEMTIR